jgi:tripartite-type tricarboxylate transporter receptor subunit TctC
MKRNRIIFPLSLTASMLVLFVLASVSVVSAAETYPSKPIRLILDLAAGGYGDITARVVAQKIGDSMGQRVVVENRPGAGAVAAKMAVIQAPADGYTMTTAGGATAVSETLFKQLPYNILNDFMQVSPMVNTDLVLLVKSDSKFASLVDVLKFAKSNPGKLNLGTSYIGSTQNLGAEIFKKHAGINAVTVPYKSPQDVIVALRSGAIDVAFDFLPTTLAQIRNKEIRGLAIAGDKRFAGLPDMPTTAEAGFPDYEVASWNGISVKTGTPRPIIDRLNKEIGDALKAPDVKTKLLDLGLTPFWLTPEKTRELMVAEIAKWKKVIEDNNIPRQ